LRGKNFWGLLGIFAIVLISTIIIYSNHSNIKQSENSASANFSEIRFSKDELINKSDLIVRCKFTGKVETKLISSKVENSQGKIINFEAPVTTYKMRSIEALKGSSNDEFIIGTMGDSESFIQKDEEYVLFLQNTPEDDKYRLTSFGQGLNKVKKKDKSSSLDESIDIESLGNENFNYKELKDKIKDLKDKNY
jgi:hypothetical protein